MPLVTARDYIYTALRKCGQMRPGYSAQVELLNDALSEWVAFFDQLGAERDAHYSNPVYEYPVLGPGSQTGGNGYLIGPTATTAPATGTTLAGGANDFLGPRPDGIIRANLVLTSQGGSPVYIQIVPASQEQWAALSIQQIPAINVASLFWYDPQFPNGVFNVFPPLNGSTIQIYQWGVLSPPATLDTAYSAPPGYADVVIYGLAERLYHMVTKEMVAHLAPYSTIAGRAYAALQKVRGVNRAIPRLGTDAPRGGKSPAFYDQNVRWVGEPY